MFVCMYVSNSSSITLNVTQVKVDNIIYNIIFNIIYN